MNLTAISMMILSQSVFLLVHVNSTSSSSSRRGKVIDRVSLPPPQYGAASLGTSKASRPSSFQPSAPSARHDTFGTTASSSLSDGHGIHPSSSIMVTNVYSVFSCLAVFMPKYVLVAMIL